MTLEDLLPLLGFSERTPDLINMLKPAGFDFGPAFMAKLCEQGMEGFESYATGLAITFNEREGYIEAHAEPRNAGEAILVAVFAYGAGSKTFEPYRGKIPFSNGPVVDRQDAIREFGAPHRSEEEDDVVEWDQWIKEGLQLRTSYRDDGSVTNIMFAVPYKGAAR